MWPWFLNRYVRVAFAAVVFDEKASLLRAKYQTACTSVPLNCVSERRALPRREFACCCRSTW